MGSIVSRTNWPRSEIQFIGGVWRREDVSIARWYLDDTVQHNEYYIYLETTIRTYGSNS